MARLLRRQNQPEIADEERVNRWLAKYCQTQELELSAEQEAAVLAAVSQRLCVITGGPGVGKTFVTRTIVALWKAMGKNIGLAAPTGRAAKRLEEVTGLEAKTLHRLLEFEPKTGGFKRNEEYPLPHDALVVDETSMLDLFLAYSLLRATPPTTHLLLVGDRDQLPSVGPGQVLNDLITSERIPVVRLTKVFRQAATSAIIRVAHEINSGQVPDIELISETPQSNCLWHGGGSGPEYGAKAISQIVCDLLPKWGYDPARDLQVLSPMIRGAVGTQSLNAVLQAAINPPGPGKQELRRGPYLYREGDRVIQLKNDYDRGVFNGDLGVVRSLRPVEQEVIVEYDGREVAYDYADLIELGLAWAITIHKSQGSEFPVVLLPIYQTHSIMLNRNLFYTGLTRAKKLAVVMGSRSAIAQTVRQESQMQRYTRLRERLE